MKNISMPPRLAKRSRNAIIKKREQKTIRETLIKYNPPKQTKWHMSALLRSASVQQLFTLLANHSRQLTEEHRETIRSTLITCSAILDTKDNRILLKDCNEKLCQEHLESHIEMERLRIRALLRIREFVYSGVILCQCLQVLRINLNSITIFDLVSKSTRRFVYSPHIAFSDRGEKFIFHGDTTKGGPREVYVELVVALLIRKLMKRNLGIYVVRAIFGFALDEITPPYSETEAKNRVLAWKKSQAVISSALVQVDADGKEEVNLADLDED
jgi:hypothetical protein